MIDPVLTASLMRVADLLAEARRSWWVIGSAAVALHGGPGVVARDVDVLIDAADMPMVAHRTGVAVRPGGADVRFRSDHALRLTDGPLPIELFADFHVVGTDGGHQRLWPATRETFVVEDAELFVPARQELIDILRWFARPKDLDRAILLER